MAKLATGPKGQVDERQCPLCGIGCWSIEGSPRCFFGCCTVNAGSVEGRCLSGLIAGHGEGILSVRYEPVLSCDAFVDEYGAISGFVWASEDGGDGVPYGWCSGDAEGCIASVYDCA
jgi:hypothetical protein